MSKRESSEGESRGQRELGYRPPLIVTVGMPPDDLPFEFAGKKLPLGDLREASDVRGAVGVVRRPLPELLEAAAKDTIHIKLGHDGKRASVIPPELLAAVGRNVSVEDGGQSVLPVDIWVLLQRPFMMWGH